MSLSFWFAAGLLAWWMVVAVQLHRGGRSIRFLRLLDPQPPPQAPSVSVIAAARNEERHLRTALASLLSLDYPAVEFVLVNDRSEDATGAILEEMAAADRRLQVIHITELPPGWLGKNHALWTGSGRAAGELLLFTDADILMDPTALSRAVRLLQEENLDHLAVAPETRMPGTFLDMFAATFVLFFSLFVRPWKARVPGSAAHIGIGAFNLVRTEAYRRAGGHRAIRLRPDDDLKLGKILKKSGGRQDVAYGTGLVAVEWYASVPEMIRGLEKNAFSGADYRIPVVLGGALALLLGGVWPYLALFVTDGPARLLYAAVVVTITAIFVDNAAYQGSRRWYAVGFPVTSLLFAWVILRTMVLNLLQGGITWRGTFYPLSELKRNRV